MILKWETLSKTAAADRIGLWTGMPSEGFDTMVNNWCHHEVEDCPLQYLSLREKLVNAYEETKEYVDNNPEYAFSATKIYQVEYRFAMQIYSILNDEGMTMRNASDDGVWRFLSIIVVPDIVYDRWKKEDNRRYINPDRFYFATRRIWLKILWWYVYLCWQGTPEETERLISTNNANEISQLVERAGSGGYRVELFREIIRYYDTNISQKKRIEEKNLLSRVLQLNIARSQIVEPDLVPGGVAEYVKSLFGYFGF